MEAPLSALESDVTPTEHFFIRSHFDVPILDASAWRLVVDGEVARPRAYSFVDFGRLARRRSRVVMECAGNSRATMRPRPAGVLWRNGAVGSAEWSGVSMRDLLEPCAPHEGAVEVVLEGADRGAETRGEEPAVFAMSVPFGKAMDPDTIIATEMNGEPLSPSHGYPARAVVPGWYGMASVKWLTRISVVREPFQGYFRSREYAFIYEGDDTTSPKPPVTLMRVKSLITWPAEGHRVRVGSHRIRGVAWSGHGRITRVEASIGPTESEKDWRTTTLQVPTTAHTWTHWELECEFDRPGFRVVRSRAFDEAGNSQPELSPWNYRGVAINSIHAVPVEVVS